VPFSRIEVFLMQKKPKCTFFGSEEVRFTNLKEKKASTIWYGKTFRLLDFESDLVKAKAISLKRYYFTRALLLSSAFLIQRTSYRSFVRYKKVHFPLPLCYDANHLLLGYFSSTIYPYLSWIYHAFPWNYIYFVLKFFVTLWWAWSLVKFRD